MEKLKAFYMICGLRNEFESAEILSVNFGLDSKRCSKSWNQYLRNGSSES